MADTDTKPLEAQPGSQPVLMAEVRYGVVFGEMNEVFNEKMHSLLVFVTTFCGLLAAASVVALLTKLAPDAALWWSFGLAVVSAFSHASKTAFKFHEKSLAFKNAKIAFQNLEGRGWSMNQGTLDKELKKLRASAPAGGSWLASAAFNKACAELGHPEKHRSMPGYIEFVANRVG